MIAHLLRLVRRLPMPLWMMLALVIGFAGGVGNAAASYSVGAAELVGGVWLDALRMTILPLVFALVVTGIAGVGAGTTSTAAHLGRRLPFVLLALLILSGVLSAILSPLMIGTFHIEAKSIAALQSMFPAEPAPAVPGTVEALRSLIPTNVIASAAAGAIAPLVVFAVVLGMALGRVQQDRADALLQALRGLSDAMIVVVRAVLYVAPLGIGALAFMLGAKVGVSAIFILGQYLAASLFLSLVLVILGCLIARIWGGVPVLAFARAIVPAQAVAAGTQSSIATLPLMLDSARRLGVAENDADVILPIAVAMFKVTAPSNTLLIALTLAWMGGVAVSPGQIALAVPLALVSTLVVLGLPGAVGLYASTTPVIVALGAPIELLPILASVDVISDILRTVANVTHDLAATVIIASPIGFADSNRDGSALAPLP